MFAPDLGSENCAARLRISDPSSIDFDKLGLKTNANLTLMLDTANIAKIQALLALLNTSENHLLYFIKRCLVPESQNWSSSC